MQVKIILDYYKQINITSTFRNYQQFYGNSYYILRTKEGNKKPFLTIIPLAINLFHFVIGKGFLRY